MSNSQLIQIKAQFGEMLVWLNRGWKPAPKGRRCPLCEGNIWLKVFPPRRERHVCVCCGWAKEYVL